MHYGIRSRDDNNVILLRHGKSWTGSSRTELIRSSRIRLPHTSWWWWWWYSLLNRRGMNWTSPGSESHPSSHSSTFSSPTNNVIAFSLLSIHLRCVFSPRGRASTSHLSECALGWRQLSEHGLWENYGFPATRWVVDVGCVCLRTYAVP